MRSLPRYGDLVMCRTADDRWIERRACGPVEKGHTFPVVRVARLEDPDDALGVPWPAEDVWLKDEAPSKVTGAE